MKKFYKSIQWFYAVLIICCIPVLSFAQITITSADALGLIGKTQVTIEDERFSIPVNVGMPGANQVWDFRSMVVQDTVLAKLEFLSPAQTAYADSFPQANWVEHITDPNAVPDSSFETFIFAEVTNSIFRGIGSVSIFTQANPPFDTTTFANANESGTPLPLNFNDSWVEFTNDTTYLAPDSSFYIVSIDTTMSQVDAWGTVKLDIGDFECLRIRDDVKEISKTIINGMVISSSTDVYISYDWVSKNDFVVANIQSQLGNTDPLFTDATGYGHLVSTGVVGIEHQNGDAAVPNGFALSQNYPNPFNPSTTISFELPVETDISLDVFDVTGKHVATLISDRLNAGSHQVAFDAENLPSGLYFYRLEGGGVSLVNRMILMK